VQEPEEEEVALLGLGVNLADASVYPASVGLHDTVVNMIAQLWHCPKPSESEGRNYSGAGTVGSTEACLLAGLALKFRWREWYRAKHHMTDPKQVLGVVPNMIISSCYQAAWEKFFRYFDVEPRYVKPTLANKMRMDATLIEGLCDENTMAVVGILGNHYNGAYDPIWDIDAVVEEVNRKNGWQIGIHVDAASGGFVAPFQDGLPPFDFRLKNVMSISASGHKFGESSCGTGWLVFRHRHDLASHIAISVTYLGGKSDSMTLNFSRPATAVYVQYYKLLRLGMAGYRKKVEQQMRVSKFLRDHLKAATFKGHPRFEIMDAGDEHCLPVVGARLNPDLRLKYNDIDLQHGVAEYHWYVRT
jgi:glutamate decarboxylase